MFQSIAHVFISIHAPAKGATTFYKCLLYRLQFQSTLPRRERPYVRVRVSGAGPISIHAPAKGATMLFRCRQILVITFQSTLPRRERLHSLRYPSCFSLHFNPRSREGSDLGDQRAGQTNIISIHAPAKGATASGNGYYLFNGDFNPRSREGSDSGMSGSSGVIDNFNPRSREGSDKGADVLSLPLFVFQSTLPRRERHAHSPSVDSSPIFQSTLPRRERRGVTAWGDIQQRFQSTLPRRERL